MHAYSQSICCTNTKQRFSLFFMNRWYIVFADLSFVSVQTKVISNFLGGMHIFTQYIFNCKLDFVKTASFYLVIHI